MRLKGGSTDIAGWQFHALAERRVTSRHLLAIFGFALALTGFPVRLEAAVITSTSIDRQDSVAELRFAVRGRSLGWHLTTHGQQLWIDLRNTRFELPHPLIASVIPPIMSVETIENGVATARIVVEVSGRDDYAIAHLPHELVLRVAPAGTVANLGAPLVTHAAYRERPVRTVPHRPLAVEQTPATVEPAVPNYRPYAPPRSTEQPPTEQPTDETPAAGSMIPSLPVTGSEAVSRHSQLAAYSYRRPLRQPATIPAAIVPSSANQGPVPLVVIDPGHGGYDPGTAASDGTREKDVALAIGIRVAAALKAAGIRAELTRTNDTFLSLAERTAAANQAGADLFVSIHMNSSPDAEVSGIETYYLNNTTDRATIRLARMENAVSGGYSLSGSPDLNYILTDMRQQYKANDAASLAQMIEGETASTVASSMGLQLKPLGAMQGPFYVLVGAMMPAVLVECGFLSNADEAHLLETPAYQQALADGIARAVADYFKSGAAVGNL
jgi:N-acetylmuramoyl-L-alanine amidase